ncbi:hypothetical protein ACFQ0M_40390 [Kitasatospora aburaviensis]
MPGASDVPGAPGVPGVPGSGSAGSSRSEQAVAPSASRPAPATARSIVRRDGVARVAGNGEEGLVTELSG